jgi:hypothetical protein
VLLVLVSPLGLALADREGAPDPETSPATAPLSSPKSKQMYFHTLADTVNVGGATTTNVMDTTRGGVQTELSSVMRVVARWFAYPAFPEGVTINDSATFSLWARASAASSPTFTYWLYSVQQDGTRTQLFTGGPGAVALTTTYQKRTFTATIAPAALPPNSTLELQVEVFGNAATTYFIAWGSDARDSGFAGTFGEHLEVASVATLDHLRMGRVNFLPTASNKTMYVAADVTDPFGGYDIHWVNVTIRAPSGTEIVSNATMSKTSGFFNSFLSTFEFAWNYSGQPSGVYACTVYATDKNGYYSFLANSSDPTRGGHLEKMDFSFTIGTFPFYVNFRVVDSLGVPLAGITLIARVAGTEVNRNVTNAQGIANISLFAGTYSMVAVWQAVEVSAQSYTVTGSVGSGNPVQVTASVYSPSIQIADSRGAGLYRASVFVTHPNGSTTPLPYRTNATGEFTIPRTAGGAYWFRASWLGVQVADVGGAIASNAPVVVQAAAYYLDITIIDSAGRPLPGASAVARNSTTGTVMDSRVSDAGGLAQIVLPVGRYDVDVLWSNTLVSGLKDYFLGADGAVTVVASVFYLSVVATDSRGAPVADASVTIGSETTGDVLAVGVTDAAGLMAHRVPTGDVRVQVRWLDVPVADRRNVNIAGNLTLNVTVDVFYVKLAVLDDHGNPVEGATIDAEVLGRIGASGTTSAAGEAELRLPKTTVRLLVHWRGSLVKATWYSVIGDANHTIRADVFYLVLEAKDSRAQPVPARFVVEDSGGGLVATARADAAGRAEVRSPRGPMWVSTYFLGVLVNRTSLDIASSMSLAPKLAIYYVAFLPVDSRDAPVEAVVSATNASSGRLYGAGIAAGGSVEMRLPVGAARVRAQWISVEVYDATAQVTADVSLTLATKVYYAQLTVVDSRDAGVGSAKVEITRGALLAASNATDDAGAMVARLPAADFDITASYRGVEVFAGTLSVAGDLNRTLRADVFYLEPVVKDSRALPVGGAEVTATLDGGGPMDEGVTAADGRASLRLPGASYVVSARWKGVEVLRVAQNVSGDTAADYPAKVFYIDVETKDAGGAPLSPVHVRALAGAEVRDAGYTTDGKLSFRLPVGSYTVQARFVTSYYLTDVSWSAEKAIDLGADATAQFTVEVYPVPVYQTNAFYAALGAALLLLLFIFLFLRIRKKRRRAGSKEDAAAGSPGPGDKEVSE